MWNYWVNNYLLGKQPPAFDILFWNSDTTRMTAALRAGFIDLATENSLARPGAFTVLGVPIDLGVITVDAYVVAGMADHITPWDSCYRSAQLFGGSTRFVLSTSGHIAGLVNPPGNPKSSLRTNDDLTSEAHAWLEGSEVLQGTWWTDLGVWLDDRSGGRRPAPQSLGSQRLRVLADAPSTYVLNSDRVLPGFVCSGTTSGSPSDRAQRLAHPCALQRHRGQSRRVPAVVDKVDPRIEVVRFDVPGVGGSPGPKVPYNFAMLACLVRRLVDRLGYDRFDALGISWGGGLAQQLAFQNPRPADGWCWSAPGPAC